MDPERKFQEDFEGLWLGWTSHVLGNTEHVWKGSSRTWHICQDTWIGENFSRAICQESKVLKNVREYEYFDTINLKTQTFCRKCLKETKKDTGRNLDYWGKYWSSVVEKRRKRVGRSRSRRRRSPTPPRKRSLSPQKERSLSPPSRSSRSRSSNSASSRSRSPSPDLRCNSPSPSPIPPGEVKSKTPEIISVEPPSYSGGITPCFADYAPEFFLLNPNPYLDVLLGDPLSPYGNTLCCEHCGNYGDSKTMAVTWNGACEAVYVHHHCMEDFVGDGLLAVMHENLPRTPSCNDLMTIEWDFL